ncbi:uncharacterized protein BDR25DRAFT_391295 [Lindgomyces ingoldianus]|uniref:Uncharacterized protein n=1 Tax=Lindgomyces ingoldianus TaxID=673940 RepID=A0ACB6RA26_9PLEO|nr:uncharacterized protein BDR25DRAFT_391295 [Lindgomyces ingoldianus]KAF2475905.1 hypothetical protein BDR25DRAFT_391295 [Lindgomyces ingoldianus]
MTTCGKFVPAYCKLPAAMRLRLSVQRHGLPPTNILWTITEEQSTLAYTIAKLLDDINRIIPLEAEHWGLEDYVVEVAGFECLHFSPVARILKDEDQVSIRSLFTADVRGRTLSGRLQISEGGQHLVDGIPFGRPYLREPNRPPIRIPPLKRRRLLHEPAAAEEGNGELAGLLTEHGHVSSSGQGSDAGPGDDINAVKGRSLRPKSRAKAVRFQISPAGNPSDSEDNSEDNSEDDGDFNPDADVDIDSSSVSSSSEETSDGSSDESSNESSEGSEGAVDDAGRKAAPKAAAQARDGSSNGSDSESSEENSDSDSGPDSSSNESDEPTVETTKKKTTPPKRGLKATQSRNTRRKEVALLKRTLQPLGLASPTASLAAARTFKEQPLHVREKQIADARDSLGLSDTIRTKKRKRYDAQTAPIGKHIHFEGTNAVAETAQATQQTGNQQNTTQNESETPHMSEEERRQLEIRRAQLLASIDSGGVDVTAGPTNGVSLTDVSARTSVAKTLGPQPSKRPRLDLGAAGRMIKAGIPPAKKNTSPKPKQQPHPEPTNPDAWKTKINYSAYECWYEEFDELSAPPFPFQQHWDKESCAAMRERFNASKRKKKGEKKKGPSPAAHLILDYGENSVDVDTVIQSQLQDDVETADKIEPQPENGLDIPGKIDIPPVPTDLDFYPPVAEEDLKVGAVIVFKHFALNLEDMTPEISNHKTAIVEHVHAEDRMVGLRLSRQDEGGLEKDDDGCVYLERGELLEAKLLKGA